VSATSRGADKLRCVLCHDDLGEGRVCTSCGAVFHFDCIAAEARCPTYGCANNITTNRQQSTRRLASLGLAVTGFTVAFPMACYLDMKVLGQDLEDGAVMGGPAVFVLLAAFWLVGGLGLTRVLKWMWLGRESAASEVREN